MTTDALIQEKFVQPGIISTGDAPRESEKEHPPGTIAVPCADLARYHAFTVSMLALDSPAGSQHAVLRSMDVTATLNAVIREMTGEWVWFQGDDHQFNGDTLMKLLDHEVDIVVPLMTRRTPPFNLVIYNAESTTIAPDGREYPAYRSVEVSELPESGLFEVHAAGSGGMLVRKHVLDTIGDPWFENPHATVINDDLEFCRKARAAGFKIYCDVDTKIGHIGHMTTYPMLKEGVWGLAFDFGGPGINRIWLSKEATDSLGARAHGVKPMGVQE